MSLSMDPQHSRCGRCGGPTHPQTIKGLRAAVCSACESATMDLHALHRLTGGAPSGVFPSPQPMRLDPSGSHTFPTPGGSASGALPSLSLPIPASGQPAAPAPSRLRFWIWVGVGAGSIFLLLIAAPLVAAIYFGVITGAQSPAEPPQAAVDLVPGTPPSPAPAALHEEPEPHPEPEPEPEPEPAPRPSRPASGQPSLSALLQRGWSQVEGNPAAAQQSFQQALSRNPDHPEANYGYGYALLRQGNATEARAPLCAALRGGDTETEREVRSLLAQRGLTCQ